MFLMKRGEREEKWLNPALKHILVHFRINTFLFRNKFLIGHIKNEEESHHYGLKFLVLHVVMWTVCLEAQSSGKENMPCFLPYTVHAWGTSSNMENEDIAANCV